MSALLAAPMTSDVDQSVSSRSNVITLSGRGIVEICRGNALVWDAKSART